MEETPKWQVPIEVAAGLLSIFFMQMAGYLIFDEPDKPLHNDVHK